MIEISTFGTIRDDGAAYVLKYREEPEPPAVWGPPCFLF